MFQEHIWKFKIKTKSKKQNKAARHQYIANDKLSVVFECPQIVNVRENNMLVFGQLQ